MAGERRAHGNRRGPVLRGAGTALREMRLDTSPAAGEDAGPRGVRGGREVEEDEKDEVVGERAKEVADAAFVTGGGKILG